MNNKTASMLENFLKRIEFFLIYIYPIVLVTVVYTAWFATISYWGYRPRPTINDPYYFGGPLTLALHWPGHTHVIPLVSYILPVAAFFSARKSIALIKQDREKELIFPLILWLSALVTLMVHPAYAWLLD